MRLLVTKAVTFHNNSVNVKAPKTKSGHRTVSIPKNSPPISEAACTFSICKPRAGTPAVPPPKVQTIEGFTAHQLRHTYAAMLYDAGVDVKSVQNFLGHSDFQVTLKIYTHLSEGKEQETADMLNEHLGN